MWELVFSVLEQPVIFGVLLNVVMVLVPLLGFGIKRVVWFFHKLSVLLSWTFCVSCFVFVLNTTGLQASWQPLTIIGFATLVGTILGNVSATMFSGRDEI